MFRFAFLVLAGIGLGALLFGGANSAAAGVGFLALIPVFFFFKVLFIVMVFGMFARRRYSYRSGADFRPPWARGGGSRRRSSSSQKEAGGTETDRFEEWHRMAHAKEEVDSWAPEPE